MSTPLPEAPRSAATDLTWRILALLNLFRLLVPLVLTGLFAFVVPRPVGQIHPALFVGALTAYFLFALFSISSLKRRWPDASTQVLLHVVADMIAINLLTFASGGLISGLAVLLILPVGAGSLIVPPRQALMFAALATIGLLTQQGFSILQGHGDWGDFAPAGIVGAIAFMLALGAYPVARKLRESDALLRQKDVDLADLSELNEFIVQHLRESILVVDAQDRIRLINGSAEVLLKGGPVKQGTLLGEVAPKLLYLLDTWRRKSYDWQASTLSLLSAQGTAMIQPHFVSLETENNGPTLIFLEDTTMIAERVQQSKLAALGRLSASIAHEIRNPVGAMSHAAQLLKESASLSLQDQRLTEIIHENGARVSTIVENVLQLSRRDSTRQERVELSAWLKDFLAEFRQTLQLDEAELRFKAAEQGLEIRVDPSHLHQLLWNLCENACKYGRTTEGHVSIDVNIGRSVSNQRPFLEVADRGPGIEVADTEQIFEPFFTSGPGGTGLGLFIARELAQCNRAVLFHEQRQGGGSIFRIVFADPQRWEI
jgi:two-component system, NtrC family, sensor histidine kinase PilS